MKMKKIRTLMLMFVFSSAFAYSQTNYSLQQCKELAVQNNAKIKKAQLEIDASQETKDAAYTKYFPSVSASLTGMYAADYLVKFTQKGGNLPIWDGIHPEQLQSATQFAYFPDIKLEMLDQLYVGNILVMQPVYSGGRISTGNQLAELAIDINKDKLNIEKYSVYDKTEDLYWKLVALKQKELTLEHYISFLNNLQKDVQVAYNAGLVDKSDLLKVNIKLSELKISKIQLQNGMEMLREALCQHIGIPFDKNFTPSDTTIEVREPVNYYQDAQSSVNNRYEMNLLQKANEAEQLQTDMKRGEYLPTVAVGATLLGMNVMEKTSYNALFVGTVSIPISGWWEASHTIQEQKIKEEIISTTKKETSELLALQVSQTWKALNESFNNIDLGKQLIEQAEENYKVVESNYKAGVVGTSDLLEAKATLQKSQDQLIEFKTTYQYSLTKYLQAIGKY